MTRAGYNGECQVDRFLKQVNFTEPYAILKEVNLKSDAQSFISIDTLIITQSYICLLEIKTIKGTLKFQSNPPQLLKDLDGVITPLKCPEQQLNRNIKDYTSGWTIMAYHYLFIAISCFLTQNYM